MAETFAHLLQQFRTRRGLTKGELAEAVGAHRQSLLDWEAGRRVPRDRARLEDLVQILALSSTEAEQLLSAARQHLPPQPHSTPSAMPDDAVAALLPAQMAAGSSRHQLRTPLPDFVGHAETIQILTDRLRQASNSGRVAAISGVRGMGGIGKTELAYLVANDLIDSFPDAQIVVSLGGSSTAPLTPTQAMQQVIYAFTPETKLPDDLESLQRHYRSLLHQKRALILADDAGDAAQVRWLLPPAGCVLLMTSRVRFTLPGMTTIDLEVLDEATAVRLLRSLCSRLSSADAQHLARACGYLPLALRISGSLLHNDPALDITTYIARLANEQQRLAQLRDPDDPQLDVAATLTLSYMQLEQPAQRVFRQIGVLVADFSTELAQTVVAAPDNEDVTALLHALLRRNLVMYDVEHDRWRLHDLVRDLARQQLEVSGETDAVQWRYARAAVVLAQHIQDQYMTGGGAAVLALSQFDAERPHIDAARRWAYLHAGTPGGDQILLNATLATHHIGNMRYDPRHEILPLWEGVRAAAQRMGNLGEEARALSKLGATYDRLDEPSKAITYFKQALTIARHLGDHHGEGNILCGLGITYYNLGKLHITITYLKQALVIARYLGDYRSEGLILSCLGATFTDLGEISKGISYHEQALTITRAIGDHRGEGIALGCLGNAYTALGNTQRAIDICRASQAILQAVGDRRHEGYALSYLARAQALQRNNKDATATFEQAIMRFQEGSDRWGIAQCRWYFGIGLAQHSAREQALPLLRAAVAYEQEIGHAMAAEHAALVARLEAGEELPLELRVPKAQRTIEDDQEASTENDAQP